MEIKRDIYLKRLIGSKHNGMIKIVTGVRRCGKSYLLFSIFRKHLKECGIDDGHIIDVDLENRRNKSLRDPDALMSYIDSRMTDTKMYYILLDEVQCINEFEDVLNSYLKIDNADVYVTGSNSRFLSTDIATEFRGRGDEIRIHPLNFSEFMSVKEVADKNEALMEYLTYGGLPQVLTMTEAAKKEDYLKNLFKSTYLQDIKERYSIKYDSDIEELINVMASGIGCLTNPLKIQNTFKTVKNSSVSSITIKNYLDILQDAFLLEKSVRYDVKGRRHIGSPAKYYFEDLGLRNALLNFRQSDSGHLMENMIYNELRIRGFSVDVGQVAFNYKDEAGQSRRKNFEIDFVCNRGFKRYYIQSAFDMPTEKKVAQELQSLSHIKDSFPKLLISGGFSPTYQDDNGVIRMNIFDFLMDGDSLNM